MATHPRQHRRPQRRPARADADGEADADADADAPGQLSVGRQHKLLSARNAALHSCLCSIVDDSAFVAEAAALYPSLPLVANMRAGAWYAQGARRLQQQRVRDWEGAASAGAAAAVASAPVSAPPGPSPTSGLATACFKSNDGHHGQWSFSPTRLNWPLALLLAAEGGALLVDATRRGKRFPDALSKTAPCWCAVLNRAVARVRAEAAASDGGGRAAAAAAAATAAAGLAGPAAAAGLAAQPSLREWLEGGRGGGDGGQQQQQDRQRPADAGGLHDHQHRQQQKQQQPQQQQRRTGGPSPSPSPSPSPPPSPFARAGEREAARRRSVRAATADQTDGESGGGSGEADRPEDAPPPLRAGRSPPPAPLRQAPLPGAPPRPKRRLPWWHADAASSPDDGGDDEDGCGRANGRANPASAAGSASPASASAAAAVAAGSASIDGAGAPPWDVAVHLPPWIGRSEAAQIEARLDGWVQALFSAAGRPAVAALASALRKPLRPLWLSQGSRVWVDGVAQPEELPFVPLVLVSASDPRSGRRPLAPAHTAVFGGVAWRGEEEGGGNDIHPTDTLSSSYEYLPGAGDDEESWSAGLTPAVFWSHAREVLSAGEAGAEAAARRVLARLAGGRHHHAPERAAAAGRAAASGEGASADADAAAAAAAAHGAGAGQQHASASAWPLGSDVPLLLGGMGAAATTARGGEGDGGVCVLLLVGPSVPSSLVPRIEASRAAADAWLAAVGAMPFCGKGGGKGGGSSSRGPREEESPLPPPPPDVLWLPVGGGAKLDMRGLTRALGPAVRFVAAHLLGDESGGAPGDGRPPRRVLVADADGASTCVVVAAAALQAMFAPAGGDADTRDEDDDDDDGENEEGSGWIGRRVRLRREAAAALAAGSPWPPGARRPSRESVRRWVAFCASRYPPARAHRVAIKSAWAFFAAASGSGGRLGLPLVSAEDGTEGRED